MKSIRTPLIALALCALAIPSFAQTAAAVSKPLGYEQVKALMVGSDDAKISKAIVGKTIAVKLMAAGPDTLVVKKGDGLYFICKSKAAGFKSGAVTAQVTQFQTTHEGDLSLTLDKCGT